MGVAQQDLSVEVGMLAFFGTVWGHLVVQAAIGGAQILLNGAAGVSAGPYAGVIQAAAAIGSELLAAASSSTVTPGGAPAAPVAGKPPTVGR